MSEREAASRVIVLREAMATEFDVTIAGRGEREARQAAEAALAELGIRAGAIDVEGAADGR